MHFIDAKSILSAENGMNVYRGCTHGCIYCDSRSRCYQFSHAFEDIEVKRNAPALLEARLRAKRARCMIGTGSMCDPYMPCEQTLGVTRACLEVIARYGFGVSVLTKSDGVLRDLPLLLRINQNAKAVVQMTLTTADDALCRIIEPNVCPTSRRIETLARLRDAGIPTVVWMTPILPFINDTAENFAFLLDACARVGVRGIVLWNAGVTLREGSRDYFYAALDRHFPGLRDRYVQTYGNAYELKSPHNRALMAQFTAACTASGILSTPGEVFAYLRDLPEQAEQLCF